MKKIKIIFAVFCTLLYFSIVSAENKKLSFMYYWEKGNKGEPISIEEFNFLVKQIEIRMEDLNEKLTKIRIEDAGFSYKEGKYWEIELKSLKEQLESAIKYLGIVKDKPNLIAPSLWVYVVLTDVLQSAYDFSRIKKYEEILNGKHIDLSFWCRAFEKAHLSSLALAKDRNIKLYK